MDLCKRTKRLLRVPSSSSAPVEPTTLSNIVGMSFASVSSNQQSSQAESPSTLTRESRRRFGRKLYEIGPSDCVIVTSDYDDCNSGNNMITTNCCSFSDRLNNRNGYYNGADEVDPASINNTAFTSTRSIHRTWKRFHWLSQQIVFVTLLLLITMNPVGFVRGEITCPPYQEIPYCSCFVLDDQLHIQCSGSDIPALKKSLQVLNGPVKSYSVYDLDARATVLPDGVTDNVTSPVFHVQLSHSSLEDLSEGSLRGLSKSLESLAIVSGKLKFIPQTTLSTLRRLKVLDFEGNQLTELGPYSFHNILLQKVNLKGNLLENISEHAFWGLEETMMEIDLSENKLKTFPYSPLRRLRLLSSLNLAWNEISELNVLSSASSSASLLLSPLSSASRSRTGVGALSASSSANALAPSQSSVPAVPGGGGSYGVIRYGTSSSSSSSSTSAAASLGSSSSLLYPSYSSGTSTGGGGASFTSYNNNNHNSNTNLEFPMLKYLNLNSNYLRKLDGHTFAAMGNLRTLSIHLNSIEMVDEEAFASLFELESIDLSHNKIIHLPSATFSHNSRLTTIDLSNNHLHLVGEGLFNNLPELRELFLNGNNILQLTGPTFLNSPKIGIIYLQGNALRLIESGVFSPLRNLTEARLSDNFLMNLPQDLFYNNEALTSLSLDGNLLKKVVPGTFHNCKGLRELRLQNNRIVTLEPGVVDNLEYLQEVHLENNKLTRLRGLNVLKRIRHVSLSRNSIERVTMEMLPGTELSSLSFGHNLIKTIDDGSFSNQTTLSILFLGSNRLTKLTPQMFIGLRALERLYLQKNNISWIHEECFSSHTKALQYIDLSYNLIKTVSRTVFSGLAFIEEINLSHNQITELEEGSFTNLRSLRILDLSYNRLRIVDYAATFHVSGLEILKICCNALVDFHVLSGSTGYVYERNSGEKYGQGGSSSSNIRVDTPASDVGGGGKRDGGGYASMMLHGGILIPGIAGGNIQVALKELDIRQNQLTASTLRQIEMGRLEVLQISGNNLTDLDEATFFGFPMLSFLAAEKARITALPTNIFLTNPNLAVLRLSDNSLTHIPDFFNPNSNEPNLHAGGEPMTSISNRGSGTGSNNLGDVRTTSSSIKSHLALRELHLRHNRILSFPYKALVNATTLEVLTLSGNRINTLDLNRIYLPRLKQFDVADNELNKVSGISLAKSMPLLEVADFGGNNISKISSEFVKNVSLTQLNFGGNAMQKVPFAFSERFITTPFLLNMSGNPLINFYTENHPSKNFSVMDLYLSDTNVSFLTSEQFKIYPKLHRLVVKRTPITTLPPNAFTSLSLLNLLDLSENDIEDIKHDSFSGLTQLKSLNLSHNRIKTLSDFHPHLGGLQDLDLSNNQLSRLMPEVCANLISLVTLRLRSNWLTVLPADLFAPLARLSVLDLSINYIETVPATVLRHLETRISTLRLEGNPLSCGCDSREFWEWLQNHPKIFSVSASQASSTGLTVEPKFVCETPNELRGKAMIELDIPSLCSSPAIVKLAIQDVRPSSAVVSWQGRNISALQGYMIGYHALNRDNQIRWTRPLPAVARTFKLPDLESGTPYRVCVLELNQSDGDPNEAASTLASRSAETVLKDTHISSCTQVQTPVHPSDSEKWVVLIQRRLGVIVGAVLGIVVFVILLTTLACVKLRKRRIMRQQNGKIDHHLTDALTAPNNVGTLGGYHQNSLHRHHHLHHHLHHGSNGNGGTTSPGNLSPEFLTYRHYSLTTDSGTCIHPSQTTTTELERL